MERENTAIAYMLSDPVLPAHWWAIRALARGIAQHRLFVLYDSNASALAKSLVRWRKHTNETMPLPHAHILPCSWRREVTKLNTTIKLKLRELCRRKVPGSCRPGHVLVEPQLACWSERFGERFTHVWSVERDAMFHGNAGEFFDSWAGPPALRKSRE